MIYKITIKKSALKEIQELPKPYVQKITSAIDALSQNPRPVSSKKLKGEEEYIWRIRVGDYRVLYIIEDVIKIVDIRKVGHRKDVYE